MKSRLGIEIATQQCRDTPCRQIYLLRHKHQPRDRSILSVYKTEDQTSLCFERVAEENSISFSRALNRSR